MWTKEVRATKRKVIADEWEKSIALSLLVQVADLFENVVWSSFTLSTFAWPLLNQIMYISYYEFRFNSRENWLQIVVVNKRFCIFIIILLTLLEFWICLISYIPTKRVKIRKHKFQTTLLLQNDQERSRNICLIEQTAREWCKRKYQMQRKNNNNNCANKIHTTINKFKVKFMLFIFNKAPLKWC